MCACYIPTKTPNFKGEMDLPLDLETGQLNVHTWERFKKNDPLVFLPNRIENLEKNIFYLDVGKYDQFNLQYGSRQIRDFFQKNKIKVKYSEFDGNHFDISKQRKYIWQWLKDLWK